MERITSYTFDCFERDPIYASFTLAFIFLPGWGGMVFIMKNGDRLSKRRMLLAYIIFFTYPLLLIFVKLVALFNDGDQWTQLAEEMTAV